MKYYLNLNEENYLLSISEIGVGTEININLADYDFSGDRINAFKFVDGELIFDEERYSLLQTEVEVNTTPTQEERITALENSLSFLINGDVKK